MTSEQQTPVSNATFLGVPRVVVVHRFDCKYLCIVITEFDSKCFYSESKERFFPSFLVMKKKNCKCGRLFPPLSRWKCRRNVKASVLFCWHFFNDFKMLLTKKDYKFKTHIFWSIIIWREKGRKIKIKFESAEDLKKVEIVT